MGVKDLLDRARVIRNGAIGMALFLLCVLVYTRLTMIDPYLELVGGSRVLANAVAIVHLVGVLSFWCVRLEGMRLGDTVGVLVVTAACGLLSWVTSVAAGLELADLLRIHIGRHAWWAILLLIVACIPVTRTRSNPESLEWWRSWWILSAASLVSGAMLHTYGLTSPSAMLAKVLLVLVVPTACLAGMALRYRGRHEVTYRVIGALGAAVGIAVATIR